MAEKEPERDERRGQRLPVGMIAAAGAATLLGALAFNKTRERVRLRAHEQVLEELAQELGAQFTPSRSGAPTGPDFPSLTMKSDDREVRIDTEVGGSGLSYQILTRATATHTAPVEGFVVIREETLLTRMADHLGLADIQVNEPAFDDRFEVISDQADAAALLHPEVRDALMASSFESVVIRQGEVTVRQIGPVTDPEKLRQSIQLAVDIAEWLETLG
ncbi:MAG TPA: hypothetical protein PLU39_15155 [Armatimonadota bacterium]|jgi:hypothetical protein|nr:hypothetical protein [Armatimonadota bacterium]HOQ30348.1 hypothetical protein [Armatimonadota bacterium]HPO73940.1 hypothetical protein [Armatimonadota bacterium]HPT99203.1 hypothetical protein [Armatimonadota bacterium]